MKLLTIVFLGSLLLGQIGGMSLFPGVVVYVHDVLLFVLLMYVLLNKKLPRAKLMTPIAGFIAAAIVSLLVNYWRFPLPLLLMGSLYLVRWTLYATLYVLVLQNYVDVKFWLKGLYMVGVGLGFIGLIQFFLYPDLRNLMYLGWDPHYYRLFSTLLDPNFLSIILIFTLFTGAYLWRSSRRKSLVIVSQLVTSLAFLLTYSRSAYLALVVGIGVFAWRLKLWKAALILLIVFFALIPLLPKPEGEGVKLMRTVSTLARIGNWQRGMEIIKEAPLFGHGFNTLRFVQQKRGRVDKNGFPSHAGAGLDNSFQFVWATTGIVGFLAYVWLLVSFVKLGACLKSTKTRVLSTVYLASLTSLLVHSLFSNSLFYPWVMIWIWTMSGVVEAATGDR